MNMFIRLAVIFFVFINFLSAFAQKSYTIIPYPNSLVERDGNFEFSKELNVKCDKDFSEQLKTVAELVSNSKDGFEIREVANNSKVIVNKDASLQKDAYNMEISDSKIEIWASSNGGVLYAFESLRQLVKRNGESSFSVPCCSIKDYPAFAWRGFMIDLARNFLGKKYIFDTIDQLALLKFNVLHLHLTDHQGWRIEIKKYPELTKVGASWCPYVKNGFLTQSDAKEIVEYAKARNITVIAELEILSHATAAVKAYPFLGDGFGVSVGNPAVRAFFRDVIDEVAEIFPSRIMHLAGDEVDYKIWGKNPSVAQYIKDNNLESLLDAHVCYMDEMGRYLESKGMRMMAWDESFGKGVEEVKKGMKAGRAKISKNVIMHFWTGNLDGMRNAAKNGHSIVNANCSYTYFNYYYSKNEKSYLPPHGDKIVDGPTKGYNSYLYSSPLSLRKSYEFTPIPHDLDEASKKNIIGTSCQIWAKPIDSVDRFYDRAFPRAAAHAEVAWSTQKDYARFLSNLKRFRAFWDAKNINYNKDYIK